MTRTMQYNDVIIGVNVFTSFFLPVSLSNFFVINNACTHVIPKNIPIIVILKFNQDVLNELL